MNESIQARSNRQQRQLHVLVLRFFIRSSKFRWASILVMSLICSEILISGYELIEPKVSKEKTRH